MPGVSRAALTVVPAAHTAGSTVSTYLLLALIALGAIGAGVLAARGHRRNPPGEAPDVGA